VTLGTKLFICFLLFLTLVGGVMVVAFRERALVKRIADDDIPAQRASDNRTMLAIFGSVFGGMLLTLIVAWMVFF
jgi:hypothetical protein